MGSDVRVITRLTPTLAARLARAVEQENRRRAIAGDSLLATTSDALREAIAHWCAAIEAAPKYPRVP